MSARPKTANPNQARAAMSRAAPAVTSSEAKKARPASAAPTRGAGPNNVHIAEIQKKLKSTDFVQPPHQRGGSDNQAVGGRKPLLGLLEEKLPDPTPQTAHKRYSSVYPCSSKLLAKKWDDATWIKHKMKIKTMKACIDNIHSSEKPSTLKSNKKSIAKQENDKRIARENAILLERMARTFTKPSALFEDGHSRTQKDLANKSKAYMRKREQANEKIDKENEILLKRLENKKASYEKKQWMAERREHLRHLLNMTKFPEAYRILPEPHTTKSAKGSRAHTPSSNHPAAVAVEEVAGEEGGKEISSAEVSAAALV